MTWTHVLGGILLASLVVALLAAITQAVGIRGALRIAGFTALFGGIGILACVLVST